MHWLEELCCTTVRVAHAPGTDPSYTKMQARLTRGDTTSQNTATENRLRNRNLEDGNGAGGREGPGELGQAVTGGHEDGRGG